VDWAVVAPETAAAAAAALAAAVVAAERAAAAATVAREAGMAVVAGLEARVEEAGAVETEARADAAARAGMTAVDPVGLVAREVTRMSRRGAMRHSARPPFRSTGGRATRTS